MRAERLQSSTSYPYTFFITQTIDHATGATGKTLTLTASKNGAAFAAVSGAITELSSGWYSWAANATDRGTLGELSIHVTGTGCDPYDDKLTIVAFDPFDSVRLGLTALPNAAAGANGGLPTGDASGQVKVQYGTSSGQISATSGIVDTNVKQALGSAVTTAAAGILDVNAKNHGGTAQTGRDIGASVLLSTGTGTGQLDFTSGVVKANLVQVLATALTETAGQIAAGFKKFFDVAVPTQDVTGVNQTGDNYARIGVAGVGLTNLGDARIANLDATISSRLPTVDLVSASGTASAGAASTITLAGAVATDNYYNGQKVFITGGTGIGQTAIVKSYVGSTKVATIWGTWAVTPDNTSVFILLVTGKAQAENGPTNWNLSAIDINGRVDVGKVLGTAQTAKDLGASATQTGDSFARIGAAGASLTALGDTRVANLDATVSSRSTYAGTDTSGTTTLLSRLTSGRATNIDNLDATVSSRSTLTAANVWDTLTSALTTAGSIGKRLNDFVTTLVYAAPTTPPTVVAIRTEMDNNSTKLANLDAAVSTRSTLTAAGVWDALLTGITTASTIGKLLKDNIDAAITSRTKPADTQAAVTSVTNDVGITQAGADKVWSTTVRAITDKAGFALSSAGVQAIWDALTSALTTAGSVGKLLVDNLNATISSRLSSASYTTPPSVAAIRSEMDSNSTKLANLDATTSSRNSTAHFDTVIGAPTGASISADLVEIEVETDTIASIPTNPLLTSDSRLNNLDATISSRSTLTAANVWNALTSGLTTVGSIGKLLKDDIDAAISSVASVAAPTVAQIRTEMDDNSTKLANLDTTVSSRSTLTAAGVWNALLTGITTAGSIGKLIKDYLDAAISSRMATFTYTAPTTPPTVAAIRAEIDTNSTQLQTIISDIVALPVPLSSGATSTAVQTGLTGQGYTTTRAPKLDHLDADVSAAGNAPTAAAIRTEMDANSTKLATLVTQTTGLATSSALGTAQTAISDVQTDVDELQTTAATLATSAALTTAQTAITEIAADADAIITSATAIKTQTDKMTFTGTDIHASVPNGGDPIANMIPGTYAAGSVGAAISEILGKANLFGVAGTVLQTPTGGSKTVIYKNRDFNAADGLSLDYSVSITLNPGDTIRWNATVDSTILTVTALYIDAHHVRVNLTAANCATLSFGNGRWEISVTRTGSGRVIEAANGVLRVEPVIA